MRLDELRNLSSESLRREREELERHAPAARQDAEATREMADAVASVPLASLRVGVQSSPPADGSQRTSTTDAGPGSVSTGGGAGGSGQGFKAIPSFLSSRPGEGRQGGIIKAEEWVAEHCKRTTFQIPNPRKSIALADRDLVEIGGWDCSGEFAQPPGTVVFYDPGDWQKLASFPRTGASSSGGGPSAGSGGNPIVHNTGPHQVGGRQEAAVPPGVIVNPSSASVASAGSRGPVATTDPKAASLLKDLVDVQRATLAELKRPGPTGRKGLRDV